MVPAFSKLWNVIVILFGLMVNFRQIESLLFRLYLLGVPPEGYLYLIMQMLLIGAQCSLRWILMLFNFLFSVSLLRGCFVRSGIRFLWYFGQWKLLIWLFNSGTTIGPIEIVMKSIHYKNIPIIHIRITLCLYMLFEICECF